MKIAKLLLLGTLVVALCMATPGIASEISLAKNTNPVSATTYHVGDTIHYVLNVGNPGTNTATNTLDLIEDIEPDGTHTTIATNVVQAPGESNTYNFDYVVDEADLQFISGKWRVVNTLHVEGTDSLEDIIDATTAKSSIVIRPSTDVGISADPNVVCTTGADVTLTVTEENDGDAALTDPNVVVDDGGGTIATLVAPPDSGDDGDGVLEPGETWSWDLLVPGVSATTTFTAVGHGIDPLGFDVTYCLDGEPNTICDANELATVEVTAVEPPVCGISGPGSVCQGDSQVQYCSDVNDADSYLWEITGDGEISGSATGDCVLVNPTGPGGFTLSLHICYGACCSDCNLPVDVIPTPDCSILGPDALCQEDVNTPVAYCTDVVADGYLWEILSGPATIDGADDANCVSIIPSDLGTIVLKLSLFNEVPGDANCWNSCEVTITVEECGQTFCSFTQGFWGNAGGKKCGGQTTTELINGCLPVVVGLPGHSITFDSAACILASLPAGGKPAVLPAGNLTCANLSSLYKNKKQTELNNVLIGQVVALTLNLCVAEGCVEDAGILADWVLPEDFCTVPYDDPNACAEYSVIPSALVGKTVQQLLAAANAALAGDTTYSLSDIYNAVTAINEGFDECRTIVPCIRPEICGNGCDDDGDGLVDGDDPDCQIIVP